MTHALCEGRDAFCFEYGDVSTSQKVRVILRRNDEGSASPAVGGIMQGPGEGEIGA